MTGAASPPEAPRRRRRWAPWLLGASVCLNLLLAGAVGGALMRGFGPPPSELPAGFDRATLWRAYKALPDSEREAARDILHDYRRELRDLARDRGAARRDIAERLSATPFSGPALAEALTAARGQEGASRALVDEAFVTIVARLAPETRDEIAAALRDADEGRLRGRWHRGDDGD